MAILIAEATGNGILEYLMKNIREEEARLAERGPLNRHERRALAAIDKKLEKHKERNKA